MVLGVEMFVLVVGGVVRTTGIVVFDVDVVVTVVVFVVVVDIIVKFVFTPVDVEFGAGDAVEVVFSEDFGTEMLVTIAMTLGSVLFSA